MKMSCAESKELSRTDTLAPVCASVYGSCGGLAGAQRACFLSTSLGAPNRLNSEVACGVHDLHAQQCLRQKTKNRALFRLAAELWPS